MIHKGDIVIFTPPNDTISTWKVISINSDKEFTVQKITQNGETVYAEPITGKYCHLRQQFEDGWVKIDKEGKVLAILRKIDDL